MQFSHAVIAAMLDQIEVVVGGPAWLVIYDLGGAAPSGCADPLPNGTVALATARLPASGTNWMENAALSSGAIKKSKSGNWQDSAADAQGTADFFRIFSDNNGSPGTTCHVQGTVGMITGELLLSTTGLTNGQNVSIDSFVISGEQLD